MPSILLFLTVAPVLSFAQAGAYDIGSAGNGIPIIIPYGPPPVAATSSPMLSPTAALTPSSAVTPSPAAAPEPSLLSMLNTPNAGSDTANAYTVLNSALQTYTALSFPTSFPVLPPPATATSVSTYPTLSMVNASAAGTKPGQTQSSSPASQTATFIPPIILSTGSTMATSMTSSESATTARTPSLTPLSSGVETVTGAVSSSSPVISTMVTTATTRTESRTDFGSLSSALSTTSSSMSSKTSSALVSSTLTTISTTTINGNEPTRTPLESPISSNSGINPGVQPATTTAAPPAATGGGSSRGLPATAGSLLVLFLGFSAL